MCIGPYVKCPLFLSDVIETSDSSTEFKKNTKKKYPKFQKLLNTTCMS